MKILVTGGCGFIGRHVCKKLISAGHTVESVDILRRTTDEGITWRNHAVDIRSENFTRVVRTFKPDIIIHAAAQVNVRDSTEKPEFDADTNIKGTINVAKQAEQVDQIIYLSTGGARYGDPDRLPVKETDVPKPKAPYGISKYAAEHYVRYFAEKHNAKHTTLCFGNVYGPGDSVESGRLIPVFTNAFLNGNTPKIFGDGEQTRDFLYVEDIADLTVKILGEQTKYSIYNVASGERTSVNEIVEHLVQLTDTQEVPQHVEARNGEVKDIVLDVTRVKDEFGFNPTSIDEGLSETVEWFSEDFVKKK